MKLTGGCLCGAVRYTAQGDPMLMSLCYCRDCQRATGAGHAPIIAMPRAGVTVTGKTTSYPAKSDSGRTVVRHFCPVCGCALFNEPDAVPGVISFLAGALDDPGQFKPQLAAYTRSRPPWHPEVLGVPAFAAQPDFKALGDLAKP